MKTKIREKEIEDEGEGKMKGELIKVAGIDAKLTDTKTIEGKEPWEIAKDRYDKEGITPEQWQLSAEQYKKYEANVFGDTYSPPSGKFKSWHKGYVRQALSEGKPVSESVLADYPELQAKPAGN